MESEHNAMNESIESVEKSGGDHLRALAEAGEYTFHGSPYKVDVLQPFQAKSDGKPDGEPAVATTPNVESAIFRSLIHRRKDEAAGRKHSSAWAGTPEGMEYMTLKSSVDALTDEDEGFVYVFAKSDHEFFAWRSELRSLEPLEPDVTIIVHPSDLPRFQTFETDEELQNYRLKLKNA